ncbi:MAG: fasciclin domain-containing protein [Rhizobacter sp.]|nr:fasciclin domain-containing protein [Chlorobiales bacterium]
MKTKFIFGVLCALFIAAASPVAAQTLSPSPSPSDTATTKGDVMETAIAAGNFKTFTNLLRDTGLVPSLKDIGAFTVFAPTDSAFAKLPKADLDALLKDKKKLTTVLNHHIIRGVITSADTLVIDAARNMNGTSLKMRSSNGQMIVEGVGAVIQRDIKCTNGIIHAIDTVIIPKSVSDAATSN